jgi:SAM-dependent methyltransferase
MQAQEQVRDFYEKLPYPPPVADLEDSRRLYTDPGRVRALHRLLWPVGAPRPDRKILIAGCGTSQAIRYALREPQARITAIDISSESLDRARALQELYQARNIAFHQLAIEEVHELGESFDQIVCTGVLHHLVNPDEGLCCLRDVLDPEGALQVMVYAAYGRTGIYMMQDYCRLLGITPSEPELDALGAALTCMPEDHPLSWVKQKTKDFQSPDGLADALLNPCDRAYTVPQLHGWLKRCDLSFGRWFEQAPYLPHCGAVARSPHVGRLAELPEPRQHAAVELFRGTITQHNFIAYRNDRPRPSQPVRFDGEQWRRYVPIRLPWALCVREGTPAGAVLLNPAHKHPEFVWSINRQESDLLSQIDGRRSLQQIADGARKIPAAAIRDFFEKLWRYDQVVFDIRGDT